MLRETKEKTDVCTLLNASLPTKTAKMQFNSLIITYAALGLQVKLYETDK